MTYAQKAKIIKKIVTNITITPYATVKKNLDHAAKQTRKALGVSL
ncbi:hypothetical protein NO1_0395 [Candidatus Termititenax aidoneus]|uniref:Uncharacterized protein n=1 Tax=Termititenax aidoneus TaxID=2218524 RepID=A0A388TB42_TERA1|nr:hypothetical protein NO1_0395 [Candidatus Termititenax aidoneus]